MIIGAGPAGSVSAAVLASRGMNTLLVDRERFPRRKLCGGCLAPAGLHALQQLGIEARTTPQAGQTLDTLRIIAPGATRDLPIKPYLAVERSSFDTGLCQAAAARGAEFRDQVRAKVLPDDSVLLEHRGRQERVHPQVIIVADGLGGASLSERPDFAPRIHKQSVIGVGALLTARPGYALADGVTMVCAHAGYVGVAPAAPGLWSLAAALDPALVRARGPHGALRAVFAATGLQPPDLAGAKLRGVGNMTRRRRAARARVLVVGDAASYAQPLTGEGMSWAIAAAARIGPYAEAAARGQDVARAWRLARARLLLPRRIACHAVCAAATRPRMLRAALGVAGLSPAGRLTRGLCWGPA